MKSLLKNASKVSGLTMVSRVFGLVRDQLFAGLIGAGFFADCFVIAFRIPNLLRDLFAEGSLSNAFVPTLTKTIAQDSPKQALVMISKLMGLVILMLGTIVLIGLLCAPNIVNLIAPGFSDVPGKVAQTAQLTRILFPFVLFISLGSVMMGIHHSHQSFTYPSIAPLMFNLCSIAGGLVIYLSDSTDQTAVIIWSVGTLCGGLMQFAIQVPPLLRQQRLPWPSFSKILANRRVCEMLTLMGPAIIALSGAQINILVNTILASLLEQGAPSWLSYGFRLMQLPIGIFGVAIGVVALAQASKDVSQQNHQRFHKNVENAMHLNWLLTIPCAVGLWVMAQPIVALLFERGAFTPHDTQMTALAIQYYALGLPFYAGIKVKGPIFFTRNLAKIPMVASLTGIGINIIFNICMYRSLGHWGLALGTSIGMLINFLILSTYFNLKFTPPKISGSALFFLKVVLISGIMGVITYGVSHCFFPPAETSELGKLLHVSITLCCAMGSYILLVKLFGIWSLLAQILRKGQ